MKTCRPTSLERPAYWINAESLIDAICDRQALMTGMGFAIFETVVAGKQIDRFRGLAREDPPRLLSYAGHG